MPQFPVFVKYFNPFNHESMNHKILLYGKPLLEPNCVKAIDSFEDMYSRGYPDPYTKNRFLNTKKYKIIYIYIYIYILKLKKLKIINS